MQASQCHLWPSPSTIFFHNISQTARFSGGKNYWIKKVYLYFLCNFRRKHFSLYEEMSEIWSKMYIGLHVKYPLFLSHFNNISILSIYFLKLLRYQVSWKSVQWEQSCSKRTDGRTDMTKLIAAFRNFANAPKIVGKMRFITAKVTLSQFVTHLCTINP